MKYASLGAEHHSWSEFASASANVQSRDRRGLNELYLVPAGELRCLLRIEQFGDVDFQSIRDPDEDLH